MSDSKYSSGDEVGVSLNMVCDEEVISTDTNSRQCFSALQALKPDTADKVKCQDSGLAEKHLQVRRTSNHKVKTVYLSRFELEGLDAVVKWLEGLPVGKRNVPKDIPEPDVLLSDMRVCRILLFAFTILEHNQTCLLYTSPSPRDS